MSDQYAIIKSAYFLKTEIRNIWTAVLLCLKGIPHMCSFCNFYLVISRCFVPLLYVVGPSRYRFISTVFLALAWNHHFLLTSDKTDVKQNCLISQHSGSARFGRFRSFLFQNKFICIYVSWSFSYFFYRKTVSAVWCKVLHTRGILWFILKLMP